jgi:hypothetical protein
MPHEERECPRCGAPSAESQEYCLECGARLPDKPGIVAVLGSAWRRRLGWYPGDWIWPALLALLVAAAAGVASALWLTDRSSSASGTLVRTVAIRAPVPVTATPPEPTTSTPIPTAPTSTTPAKRQRPATLVTWPAGKSGWTIVLDSIPTINGRAGAVAEAKQALRLGLMQVGVLESASFSSLHPGYFVVFAGIYDTEAEAQSHIIDAHRHGYRGPYPRPITP